MHLLVLLRKLLKWHKEMSVLQSKYKNYPRSAFLVVIFCFVLLYNDYTKLLANTAIKLNFPCFYTKIM
jgi:hypothetical protein